MLFLLAAIWGACSYSDDPFLAEDYNNCKQSKSATWDCSVNRCINTKEANELRNAFKECNALTDTAAQKKCSEDVARKFVGDLPNSNESYVLGDTIYALALTLAIINFASTKSKTSCTSKTIFGVSAVASTALELKLYFDIKNSLEDLGDAYKKVAENGLDAQREAFLYLRKEQEEIKNNADARKNAYTAIGAMYGAAGAVALMETTKIAGMKPCELSNASETNPTDPTSTPTNTPEANPSTSTYYQTPIMTEFNMSPFPFTPNLYAAGPTKSDFSLYAMLIGAVGGVALRGTDNKFINFFKTSPGIATISGIAAIISFSMVNKAKGEAEQAEKNIQIIDEILARFDELTKKDCMGERDNMEMPTCYCYTDDGKRNKDRTNSATCQLEWQRHDFNYFVKPENYDDYLASLNDTGCITKAYEYDEYCQCKKIAGTSGSNYCLSNSAVVGLGGLSSGLGIDMANSDLTEVANGKYSDGFLNPSATYGSFASKNENLRKELQERANKDPNKEHSILPNLNSASNIIRKTATKGRMNSLRNSPLNSSSLATELRPDNKYIKEALRSAPLQEIGGSGLMQKKDAKEEEGILSKLMQGASNDTGNSRVIGGFEDVDISESNFDINTSSNTIWQIISNRYQTTGSRRLFP